MKITADKKTTILLTGAVIVLSLCKISASVLKGDNEKHQESVFREIERERMESVKELLVNKGFENSGITMTRVRTEEGNRDYTLTIHHKKINSLTDKEKEILEAEIYHLLDSSDNCSFRQEFLVSDL